MNKYTPHLLGIATALVTSTANSAVIVGGHPAFNAVRSQIEAFNCGPVCVLQTSIDTDFSEAGTESHAYSKARADFGVNGTYAIVNSPGAEGLEAYAESIWSDGFSFHGGDGESNVQIAVHINGSLDGLGHPGGPGSNAFYTLFISNAPISCDFDEISCTGTPLIALTEPLNGDAYFLANIAFTYDKPFYLASYLGSEVVGGSVGTADFFHSAHFGIDTPNNSFLTTSSGSLYQSTASLVPEPESLPLFLTGIFLI